MGLNKKYRINDLLDGIVAHIHAGHIVHLQWECQGCHEKITADDPIKLVNFGQSVALYRTYLHSTKDDGSLCGISTPLSAEAFNFMVAIGLRI